MEKKKYKVRAHLEKVEKIRKQKENKVQQDKENKKEQLEQKLQLASHKREEQIGKVKQAAQKTVQTLTKRMKMHLQDNLLKVTNEE